MTFKGPKNKCGFCTKTIAINQKFVNCMLCKNLIHITCNNIERKSYDKLDKDKQVSMCIKCNKENLPFFSKDEGSKSETFNKDFLVSDSIKTYFKGINDFNNQRINEIENSDEDIDLTPIIDCRYFDINSFEIFKTEKKQFSIIHLNIASLSLHKEELESVLTMLDFKFDVIGISETKILKDINPNYDISINGYNHFSTPTESAKGGVILYVAMEHNCNPIKDLDLVMYKTYVLESVFTEIIIPNKNNILLGCVYRHPSMELKDFNVNYLDPLLDKLDEKKHAFLLGDFNIDLMKNDSDTQTANFLDSITSNSFVPHIIHPTRITPHSKTLIDNIFSNSQNFSQAKSGNLTLSISDHLAQFLIIPLDVGYVPRKIYMYKRDTKNFDRENFFMDLISIDWPSLLRLDLENPDLSYSNYASTIGSLIDKYMPLKKRTQKEIKEQYKPWITKEILSSIREREKLHKKFIKAKDEIIKNDYHKKYKELRNQILNKTRQSKKDYFHNFFEKNSNNIKNTWKGIKTIIHINNKSKSQPSSLLVNNELISKAEDVSRTFNTYFSTIASELRGKMHHHCEDFSTYLKDRNSSSFFINPTNKFEVINIINNIDINKANGPHSIPTDILHLIKLNVAQPLADIINLSFEKGVYIDILKISKVIPIFKEKGSNLDCSNYRPISLLSNINKIVEKIMHERLYAFLTKHKCIYDLQFGFRKGHSTNHALLDLTEDIRKTIDDNMFAVGIFIDLQKAFDTVDHDILIKKLSHYGVRGVPNDWFRSYLSNRKQFVSINGVNSNLQPVQYGVPQGSVLGPLLFLIYINDLHSAITFCTTRHFADDTNLLIKNKSLKQLKKQLNLDLRKLVSWLNANKISLNASKTEMLIFRNPKKKLNYNLKIKLNGKRLYSSKFVKYLGILIDPHLNWSHHTESLAPKLSRSIGMLSKVRHYVNKQVLRNIYFGIFSSILNYGAQIWGQNHNKHIARIMKLQDRAIRVINFSGYREPTSKLYKSSNILKFKDNITLNNYIYVHDSMKGRLPFVLSNNFEYLEDNHTHDTRILALQCVKLPVSRTLTYGIHSVTGQSSRAWNYLQINCSKENLHSRPRGTCKERITKFFIDNY